MAVVAGLAFVFVSPSASVFVSLSVLVAVAVAAVAEFVVAVELPDEETADVLVIAVDHALEHARLE